MRVAIADDSALFRRGLTLLLEGRGIHVTHQHASGKELFDAVAVDPPDAAILDIRMPPTHTTEGIDTAHRLRDCYPRMGVLVLSSFAQTSYAVRLLEHGESGLGYLLKDHVDDVGQLRSTLDRLVAGESVLDPEVVAGLVLHRQSLGQLAGLSSRERDVLRLMAEGRSNAGISASLFVGAKSVEAAIASLFLKLDLPVEPADNRRVLAVLKWLRSAEHQAA